MLFLSKILLATFSMLIKKTSFAFQYVPNSKKKNSLYIGFSQKNDCGFRMVNVSAYTPFLLEMMLTLEVQRRNVDIHNFF